MASPTSFRGRGKSNGEIRKDERGWNSTKPVNTANKQVGLAQPNAECTMDEHLKKLDLFRKPVAKDGSCLFRVVAEQVFRFFSLEATNRYELFRMFKRTCLEMT